MSNWDERWYEYVLHIWYQFRRFVFLFLFVWLFFTDIGNSGLPFNCAALFQWTSSLESTLYFMPSMIFFWQVGVVFRGNFFSFPKGTWLLGGLSSWTFEMRGWSWFQGVRLGIDRWCWVEVLGFWASILHHHHMSGRTLGTWFCRDSRSWWTFRGFIELCRTSVLFLVVRGILRPWLWWYIGITALNCPSAYINWAKTKLVTGGSACLRAPSLEDDANGWKRLDYNNITFIVRWWMVLYLPWDVCQQIEPAKKLPVHF